MSAMPALSPAMLAEKVAGRGIPTPHLRAWRLWAGLSRDDLAALAGLSGVAVRNVEWGQALPRPRTIGRIAAALGVPADIFQQYAPFDAEADYWAREVAVKFARERAARRVGAQHPAQLGRGAHRATEHRQGEN